MQRPGKIIIAKFAAILSVIPLLIYAYSAGPDPRKTGAPGDSPTACIQSGCHLGTVNQFSGSVSVNFPNGLTYAPGVKQHLSVTVTDPGQKRWGFQLTARLASNLSGGQAGDFTRGGDGLTQVICDGPGANKSDTGPCPSSFPVEFIEHTSAGTRLGLASPATFEFDWTPPAGNVGDIVFYVAGNAANGNTLADAGDHIYTAKYTLTPSSAGGNKPAIAGVVNGAGFQPVIQQGSWTTITGTTLATTTRIWRDDEIINGKLPTSLDGVSVTINGKPAFIYYISPTQINLQAPSDDSTGNNVPVAVTNAAGASDVASAQLQRFSPAFFLWNAKYVVATRVDGTFAIKPDSFPGLTTAAAKPDEVLIFWGTGFGPTNPSIPAGQTVTGVPACATNPTILIGNQPAPFIYCVLSPGNAGLYQIAVRVPSSLAAGDQAVVAQIGGTSSPANVFLTVTR